MSIFEKIASAFRRGASHLDVDWEPGYLTAPVTGRAIALKDAGEPVFASEVMGKGVAIEPRDDVLFSPADGVITMLMDSLHAVGLMTDDGIEVLMHIGIDTVEMGGSGFRKLAEKGARVSAGTPLVGFDRDVIKQVGYPDTVFVVVTNTDSFNVVEPTVAYSGSVTAGEKILRVVK